MRMKFGALLASGFVVLATIATATGNFAVRLESASQQAAQAAGIGIDRIVLTQGPATGHRNFTERSNVIAPSAGFNIYFEPTGLATRFENGAVRASMSVDVLIRNAQGQTVAVRDNAWQLPVSHASATLVPLPPVYGDLSVNPLRLAEGRYQIVLRIHDEFAGTHVDRVLDIEMRQRAAAGPRLSQSLPAAR
ncbi:MAG: hypothetical protein SFW09_09945 [Hyphomicrobiaceae bacterium]|nr:hypothetical protein [Hyphomicrobiaceae bacterium]